MRKLIIGITVLCFLCSMGIAKNLALTGTITASPTGWEWYEPLAIDNHEGTGYHSGSVGTIASPVFFKLDLGASYDLKTVEIVKRVGLQGEINGCTVKVTQGADPNIVIATATVSGGSPWVWTNSGAGFPGARYIYIERTNGDYLAFMELRALDYKQEYQPKSYASEGTITASQDGWGWVPGNAIDGNHNTGYHTDAEGSGKFFELDLTRDRSLSAIQLLERSESIAPNLDGYQVKAMRADRSILATSEVISGDQSVWTWDPNDGFEQVRYIRVETTVSKYLGFMEIRAVERYPYAKAVAPVDDTKDIDSESDVTLSWTTAFDPEDIVNPYPGVTGHYVYFGTNPAALVKQGGLLSVETTTYTILASQIDPATTYYWRIDERLGSDTKILTGSVNVFSTYGKADTPFPAVGAVRIGQNTTLGWRAIPVSGISYDVYLGKTSGALAKAATVSTNAYTPSPAMDPNSVYYWRVDVVKNGTTITGDEWNFTTGGMVVNPSPVSGTVGVSTLPLLSWQGDLTGSYIDAYDVYFGSTANPAFAATVTITSWQVPAELADNTTYYWKVVAKHAGAELVPGQPIWSFTTGKLLAYWPMSDPNDVVSGLTTSVVKKLTTSHDPNIVPGIVGNATQFFGEALYKTDHSTNPSYWDSTGTALTVAAWMAYPIDAANTNTAYVSKNKVFNAAEGWGLQMIGFYNRPRLRTGGSFLNGPLVDDTKWHFVVASAGPQGRQMWIDGLLVSEAAGIAPFTLDSTPVCIGGRIDPFDTWVNGFVGTMDEVRIFSRPLTETQMLTLYKNSPMAKLPNPANAEMAAPYDGKLSWTPGGSVFGIAKQKLYYGKKADLSDATVVELAANVGSYDIPGNLSLKTKYFWRVDSLAANDSVIWQGKVWRFTVRTLSADLDGSKKVNLADFAKVAAEWLKDSKSVPNHDVVIRWTEYPDIQEYFEPLIGYYFNNWAELNSSPTGDAGFTPTVDQTVIWHMDIASTTWQNLGQAEATFTLMDSIDLRNYKFLTLWVKPHNVISNGYHKTPAWLYGWWMNEDGNVIEDGGVIPQIPDGTQVGWTEASDANGGQGCWVKLVYDIAGYGMQNFDAFNSMDLWMNWADGPVKDLQRARGNCSFEFGDIVLTPNDGLTNPVCWDGSSFSAADFNKDCVVDVADLAELVNEWLWDAN